MHVFSIVLLTVISIYDILSINIVQLVLLRTDPSGALNLLENTITTRDLIVDDGHGLLQALDAAGLVQCDDLHHVLGWCDELEVQFELLVASLLFGFEE